MHVIRELNQEYAKKISLILGFAIIVMLIGRYIASGAYVYFLILFFSALILILFHKFFEFFILFVLIVNHEFFYLVQRPGGIKNYEYQALLYLVILITAVWYFFREKEENGIYFTKMTLLLLFMTLIGVCNSYLQGQPFLLGLSASKGYFLILFYFVFMAKKMELPKLFNFIVITGIFITLINNIQYVFYDRIHIFTFARELERAGQLRFMQGGFFVIFSSFIALGEYFRTKKKLYLAAFIYMTSTVIIQGQTRAIIGGYIAATFLILVLLKKINFKKAVFLSAPAFVLLVWITPIIQATFFGELYNITRYEITQREGNVGVRLEAYNSYYAEIVKSPVFGRGIWNVAFKEDNPEDKRNEVARISDVGITDFLLHFGLMGAIWLIALFVKVYRSTFYNLGRLKENMHAGLIGFFIFCISIMPTINRLTHPRSIVYLALVLAMFSQLDHSCRRSSEIE